MLTSSAVMVGEVTTLDHEIFDNTVEGTTFVSESITIDLEGNGLYRTKHWNVR